jgi:hypothetical protein
LSLYRVKVFVAQWVVHELLEVYVLERGRVYTVFVLLYALKDATTTLF